jgi:hypothetical protein
MTCRQQAVLKHLTLHAVSLHDETEQEDISSYVSPFVLSDRKVRRWHPLFPRVF